MDTILAALAIGAGMVISFLVACRLMFGGGGSDKTDSSAKLNRKYDLDDDLSG